MKKYAVRLDEEKGAALERAATEDKRTFNAIFEIGLDLYLGSRNNWRVTELGETIRVTPGETQ